MQRSGRDGRMNVATRLFPPCHITLSKLLRSVFAVFPCRLYDACDRREEIKIVKAACSQGSGDQNVTYNPKDGRPATPLRYLCYHMYDNTRHDRCIIVTLFVPSSSRRTDVPTRRVASRHVTPVPSPSASSPHPVLSPPLLPPRGSSALASRRLARPLHPPR